VVGLGRPLLDSTQKPPSGHFAGHSELGKDTSSAFEDGDGDAGAFGKEFSGGGDAAAGAEICDSSHAYCHREYAFRIDIVAST
jgi:hypothetical protein